MLAPMLSKNACHHFPICIESRRAGAAPKVERATRSIPAKAFRGELGSDNLEAPQA